MGFMSGMIDGFMDTGGASSLGGSSTDMSSASEQPGANGIVSTNPYPSSSGAAGAPSSALAGIQRLRDQQAVLANGAAPQQGQVQNPSSSGAAGAPSSALAGIQNLSDQQAKIRQQAAGASSSAGSSGASTGQSIQKIGQAFSKGQKSSKGAAPQQGQVQMPGNSYSALFGSQTAVGNFGGGRIGVQAPQPMQAPTMVQAPPMAPQMQVPIAPPAPPPPMPITVSDVRAKYRFQSKQKANQELDVFLQRVYDNVTKRKS